MWSFLGKIEQVWTKVCAHLCAHFFMANSRFYLDNRRVQAGKPSLMKIAIVHQHKQAMINTSIKLMPDQWDEQRQRVVNHPDKQLISIYLNKLRSQIDTLILRLTNENVLNNMNVVELKNFIMEEQPHITLFCASLPSISTSGKLSVHTTAFLLTFT